MRSGRAERQPEIVSKDGLSVQLHDLDRGKRGIKVRGLRVEEIVERIVDKLMPLLDRSNRMMLRNLKALQDHRRPTMTSVNIGQAGHVNVAAVQTNQVGGAAEGARPEAADA